MAYSNVLDPTRMTPTQRHCEVAAILAQGLIRLRIPSPGTIEKGEQSALDLSGE